MTTRSHFFIRYAGNKKVDLSGNYIDYDVAYKDYVAHYALLAGITQAR